MANKKNNSYKQGNTSSHSKATRITVLVLAFLMVAGILVTMIGLIINAIIGDDHDHDHNEESSKVTVTTPSSNKGTADVKPSTSSTADSTADSKPASSSSSKDDNAGTADSKPASSTGSSTATADSSK